MITDKDIAKMKKVFATKDDIKSINGEIKQLNKKFDTLSDVVVDNFESTNKAIGTLAEDVADILNIVSNENQTNAERLDDHDRQINRLNEKVFSTT